MNMVDRDAVRGLVACTNSREDSMGQDGTLKCPTCRAGLTPIVYGLPGPELFEAAERGEIQLGGCDILFDNPSFECRGVDHHLWRRNPKGGLAPISGGPADPAARDF